MNACFPRAAAVLLAAVAALNVEHNPLLRRRALVKGGAIYTFCNWAVEQLLLALGVVIPGGMLARQQIAYFTSDEGKADGWRVVDELEAQQLAELGCPVVAGWINPDPKRSSHVAIVVPARGKKGTHVMQAGKVNGSCMPIAAGFGPEKLAAIEFYAHP